MVYQTVYKKTRGELTLIIGNMFSGKTSELIRLVEDQEKYGKKKVLIIKPDIDTRSGNFIKNAHGLVKKAMSVSEKMPWKIIKTIEGEEKKMFSKFNIIAFDEIQFYSMQSDFFKVVNYLLGQSYEIFAAGLAFDFRGEPFGSTLSLTGLCCQRCIWLHSLCAICGEPAFIPQRLIDGKPAPYDSPQILIGGTDKYEPRCYEHFKMLQKLELLI